MSHPCPGCGCTQRDAANEAAHAVIAALADYDLDLAIESGLLTAPQCTGCSARCSAQLRDAREQRATALAARERFRARTARLQRRDAGRALPRSVARPSSQSAADAGAPDQAVAHAPSSPARPALPAAAAAALARAKAKAAERGQQ